MVDYEINGNNVTNFKMVVADWGSACGKIKNGERLFGGKFFGGTPVYAGPETFKQSAKDLFSFGRLAMELFMDKSGKESKL